MAEGTCRRASRLADRFGAGRGDGGRGDLPHAGTGGGHKRHPPFYGQSLAHRAGSGLAGLCGGACRRQPLLALRGRSLPGRNGRPHSPPRKGLYPAGGRHLPCRPLSDAGQLRPPHLGGPGRRLLQCRRPWQSDGAHRQLYGRRGDGPEGCLLCCGSLGRDRRCASPLPSSVRSPSTA